jgi:hypothetical protein
LSIRVAALIVPEAFTRPVLVRIGVLITPVVLTSPALVMLVAALMVPAAETVPPALLDSVFTPSVPPAMVRRPPLLLLRALMPVKEFAPIARMPPELFENVPTGPTRAPVTVN